MNLLKIIQFIKHYWGEFLVLLIPIALAIPVINGWITASLYRLIPTLIIFIISLYFMIRSRKLYSKILKENVSLTQKVDSLNNTLSSVTNSLESTPELIIKHLFTHLDLDLSFNERISIYRYDLKKEEFIPIGRHSPNPEYTKQGRQSYPKNEGVISKAWLNGSYLESNLPVFENNSTRYYSKVTERYNLTREVIEKMSMKSRWYYCKNLKDSQQRSIAVIVIESTQKLSFSKEHMDNVIQNDFINLLIESIENLLPLGGKKI